MNRKTISRVAVAAAAAGAAAAAVATVAPTASAAPSANTLTVAYKASGTSYLAKPNTTINLGPTTLTATLNLNTNKFTGTLPLPPTPASFNALGILPTSATVNFIPVGKVTGNLSTGKNVTAHATAVYTIQLTDIKVAGIPTFQGDSCETVDPVSIPVNTPKGKKFNVVSGGTLTGTYSVGQFANCGLITPILNALVPGDGNTVTFTVSDGMAAGS